MDQAFDTETLRLENECFQGTGGVSGGNRRAGARQIERRATIDVLRLQVCTVVDEELDERGVTPFCRAVQRSLVRYRCRAGHLTRASAQSYPVLRGSGSALGHGGLGTLDQHGDGGGAGVRPQSEHRSASRSDRDRDRGRQGHEVLHSSCASFVTPRGDLARRDVVDDLRAGTAETKAPDRCQRLLRAPGFNLDAIVSVRRLLLRYKGPNGTISSLNGYLASPCR